MTVTVRSFSKINLGLCIGPRRPDGFHELRTLYQTIALHDVLRLQVGRGTGIEIRCNDPRVPKNHSNTCYRILEQAMAGLGARGHIVIDLEKRLPVQGGLGGASGNAVATLLALERALKKKLSGAERMRIAAEVGSDLPLFLVGGTVLGVGRGEEVYPLPDLPSLPCVIAIPEAGVSTPTAFADWDSSGGAGAPTRESQAAKPWVSSEEGQVEFGLTAPVGKPAPALVRAGSSISKLTASLPSDRMNEFSRTIASWLTGPLSGVPVNRDRGRAEIPLLDLVRAGIENDFERVVFPKYPELREVKSVFERAGAVYASLSGSGSAVYGLFACRTAAERAAARVRKRDIPAVVTSTLTRRQYWRKIFE